MTTQYRTLRYITADVFTSAVFSGNQLAIVFGAEGLPSDTLQAVAREFNYSETVFVFAPENPAHSRRVRIFTPAAELPFAGHPTIGTAHILLETGEIESAGELTTVVLEEGAGAVPVIVRSDNGRVVHARLTAPMLPDEREATVTIEQLAHILSLSVEDFTGGHYLPTAVSCGVPFLMVPVKSVAAVRKASVNLEAFNRLLRGAWASEPMVFTMDRDDTEQVPAHVVGCDIRARVFVPSLGIPEDPATGSACACLAAYLAARTPREGLLRWEVAQGVEMGRASRITIEAEKEFGSIINVHVGGSSVRVSEGVMRVPDV